MTINDEGKIKIHASKLRKVFKERRREVVALENYQKQLEAEKVDLEQEMGGVKARIEELKTKLKK